MSTKIWTAYKMRDPRQFWEFVHDARLKATKNVQEVLRRLYANFVETVDTSLPAYQKELERQFEVRRDKPLSKEEARWRASMELAHYTFRDGYRISSTRLERDHFDFDVSIAFRSWEGSVYAIPHCDMLMRRTLDFLKDEPRLRDYHYQNQSDAPTDVSMDEWKERERVWHGMDEADRWKDVLLLDICKHDFYWQIDPYMAIVQERARRKKSDA